MENKIKVKLDEKSYDILVKNGAINELDQFLGQKYSKIFVLSDENVAQIHGKKIKDAIGTRNFEEILIKSGENSKSFEVFEEICEEILAKNIDRKSLIIAFGGGVVGDLAGFVASVLLRGIDFVQVPTSLLACVDSSVGGKTAINSKGGKNLIGSFYQPKLVICDLDILKSLPKREILAGYAEILKYGLIQDFKFFEFLEENYQEILELNEEFLSKAIVKSCQAKADIVSKDEKEIGIRALLNFGHTFAHSIENEAGYDGTINHGEAVGIGMLMAAEMSFDLEFLGQYDFSRIKKHIEKCGLNFSLKSIKNDWNLQNLTNNLYKDKKTENNSLNFILLNKIGEAFVEKGVDKKYYEKIVSKYI